MTQNAGNEKAVLRMEEVLRPDDDADGLLRLFNVKSEDELPNELQTSWDDPANMTEEEYSLNLAKLVRIRRAEGAILKARRQRIRAEAEDAGLDPEHEYAAQAVANASRLGFKATLHPNFHAATGVQGDRGRLYAPADDADDREWERYCDAVRREGRIRRDEEMFVSTTELKYQAPRPTASEDSTPQQLTIHDQAEAVKTLLQSKGLLDKASTDTMIESRFEKMKRQLGW